MATAISKQEASWNQALAGTTAVLGAFLTTGFLAWGAGTHIRLDPGIVMLLASLVPAAVAAQFALNTDRPPALPVKSALRFAALALGITAVMASVVGISSFNVFGFFVPAAAMAGLVVLASTAMAGLGYATLGLGDAQEKQQQKQTVAARAIHFEPSNDRQAMRDFDRRLQQALAEAQIEVEFDIEEAHVQAHVA
ncbi:MAG: hypothetical protein R3E66_10590 [bacterium]